MSTHRHWYSEPFTTVLDEDGQPILPKTHTLYVQQIEDADCDGSYEAEIARIAQEVLNQP